MRNASIARWVLENRCLLNALFTELNWPNRYFTGLSDFQVEISLNGYAAFGRGTDLNPDIALEKAAAECLERWIALKLKISPLGFALSGGSSAEEHALDEAYERHLVRTHLQERIPIQLLSKNLSVLYEESNFFERQFLANFPQASIKFGVLRYRESDSIGIVCLMSYRAVSCVFGSAFGKPQAGLVARAFYEAMPNYAFHVDSMLSKDIGNVNPSWNCDPKTLSSLDLLVGANEPQCKPIFVKPPELTLVDLSESLPRELQGCPIDPVAFFYEAANG